MIVLNKYINRIIKTQSHKHIIISIFLNLMALTIGLVFFEITPKADDYDMCNVIYGGISGGYSYFTLYTSVIYGYLLKTLLTIAPYISWYYITQILAIFISLSVCVWVLFERMTKQLAYFFSAFLLVVGTYEFYIRITFSKTAGLLIATGLLLILYFLYQEKLKWERYIFGMCLVLFGILLRGGMLNLVAGIFFGAFINFLIEFRYIEKKEFVRRILVFVILMIVFEASNKVLLKYDQYVYSQNPSWESYLNEKSQAALLFDYSWPEYNSNRELYDSLNISANDYVMWKNYVNINDDDVLDMDRIRALRQLFAEFREDKNSFFQISKGIVRFLNTDITFCFVLFGIMGFLILYERRIYKAYPILLMMITMGSYMLCVGRQKHHTTGLMMWTVGILLLFYLNPKVEIKQKTLSRLCVCNLLVLIVWIHSFYGEISRPSYDVTGKQIQSYYEFVSDNREKIKKLSEQKENVYIFPMYEALFSLQCFSPLETYENDFYSNIIRVNICKYPPYKESLKKYGIENIWRALVEKDNVYYCVSDSNEGSIKNVQKYYNEHYSDLIVPEKVDEIEDINVYRFTYMQR